jgi:hypothetical protein
MVRPQPLNRPLQPTVAAHFELQTVATVAKAHNSLNLLESGCNADRCNGELHNKLPL